MSLPTSVPLSTTTDKGERGPIVNRPWRCRGLALKYLLEVAAVVEREGLDPETAFAMHTPPMPWERGLEVLSAARGVEAPSAPTSSVYGTS